MRNALVQLGAPGITSILLEGGPHLAGAFLDAGEVDEIRLFVAPVVLGGSSARDPLEGEGAERIASAMRALSLECSRGRRRRADHRPHAGVVGVFTGLVADLGTVTAVDATADGVRLAMQTSLAGELREGDSVAVNGVCLTATAIADGVFAADVMHESLRRSSLAEVAAGATVNLELPLRAADRLGGHVVQGHVDGVGRGARRRARTASRASSRSTPRRAAALRRREGLDRRRRRVAHRRARSTTTRSPSSLIPETLERTTLGAAEPGRPVNLEVDVLAKYVEKLVAA